MWRGLRVVAAVVGAIGLAQISGGVAMTARSWPSAGLVVAALGATLLALAVILVRMTRRGGSSGNTVPPDASRVAPTMEMPIWTPRHVPPVNGEVTPRSATWALLESMRADALSEAAKEAQAREEAARHAPPRDSTPPE